MVDRERGLTTMKYATAHLRKETIFLNPVSRTTKGFLITWDPLVATNRDDPELGKRLLYSRNRRWMFRIRSLGAVAAQRRWPRPQASDRTPRLSIWRNVLRLLKTIMRSSSLRRGMVGPAKDFFISNLKSGVDQPRVK